LGTGVNKNFLENVHSYYIIPEFNPRPCSNQGSEPEEQTHL
jgi:hypothetical protein